MSTSFPETFTSLLQCLTTVSGWHQRVSYCLGVPQAECGGFLSPADSGDPSLQSCHRLRPLSMAAQPKTQEYWCKNIV